MVNTTGDYDNSLLNKQFQGIWYVPGTVIGTERKFNKSVGPSPTAVDGAAGTERLREEEILSDPSGRELGEKAPLSSDGTAIQYLCPLTIGVGGGGGGCWQAEIVSQLLNCEHTHNGLQMRQGHPMCCRHRAASLPTDLDTCKGKGGRWLGASLEKQVFMLSSCTQ